MLGCVYYPDVRRGEFGLWGVLVLLLEEDCSYLALVQEGQHNQPIGEHGWE